MSITHTFVSPVSDNNDPNEVGPDEWNDAHVITGLTGTPAVVLSTTAATGSAATVLATDAQIIAFDATVPVTQAAGDAAAAGSAAVAARRDHVHGMPVAPVDVWIGPGDPRSTALLGTNTANTAYLTAFQVFRAVSVTKIVGRIGTASGNVDFGLYSSDGTTATLLNATGSIACPTAAVRVINTVTSTALSPGVTYFVAVAFDNATATLAKLGQVVGPSNVLFQGGKIASSFPLPASVTLSSLSASQFPILICEA